jgi:hypothetical protein
MKGATINDSDREEWVNNDEGLYDMWRRSGRGITRWVREHRAEIDEVIRAVRDTPPAQRQWWEVR